MKELTLDETTIVNGGSVLGVVVYGTIGFWVGAFTGVWMGIWPAIPFSMLGITIGAYLGTDSQPQYIYVIDSKPA